MKINKLLLMLFICFFSCKGQNACDCSSLGKSILSFECYDKILSMNNQIISCLIDSIDIQKTLFVGFKNSMSSYIGKYHINRGGIIYAYLIDYILSKDSIETVIKYWSDNEDFLHWEEKTKPYRIYNFGVIVKQDENGKPILEPLTHEDMVKIKKMYLDWWEQNKDKSIEILREEFRKGNKILQLPYVWI